MNINDALKIVKPISDQIVADYLAKSPEQQRAEALAEIEQLAALNAQDRLAGLQLGAAMACVTARLMGLPDPDESRRIISALPVEHPDA